MRADDSKIMQEFICGLPEAESLRFLTLKSLLSIVPTSYKECCSSVLNMQGFHNRSASFTCKEERGGRGVKKARSDCHQEEEATKSCKRRLLLKRLSWTNSMACSHERITQNNGTKGFSLWAARLHFTSNRRWQELCRTPKP